MTSAESYDEILGLRAIREYRDESLTAEDLTAILEAARWTGSSKNQQGWAFIVVDDPEQQERLAATGSFTTPVRNAPVTIALVDESNGYEFDIGRAAQNIMLAAQAIGVASCPVTLHKEDLAAQVLDLPAGSRCRYAVALGYPAEDAAAATWGGRKPLDELVHSNRYRG
jgi:nitroreductase